MQLIKIDIFSFQFCRICEKLFLKTIFCIPYLCFGIFKQIRKINKKFCKKYKKNWNNFAFRVHKEDLMRVLRLLWHVYLLSSITIIACTMDALRVRLYDDNFDTKLKYFASILGISHSNCYCGLNFKWLHAALNIRTINFILLKLQI